MTDSPVADETMRNDPVRRQAVRDQIGSHQYAFRTAQRLVDEAYEALAAVGYASLGDDPLLDRCAKAVFNAKAELARTEPFVLAEPTDTYIGNAAAFGRPTGWTPAPAPTPGTAEETA